ncbi:alpha/beta fold hydrolase [Natrinema salsiterrestre]|uniref:Alpha/beta hydrolase n=1 Tax=Natrinema salsiterrestre TaxID=2950540 RepID=A0A9Q4PZ66_9EURY|nr:alpha/beta hydrolase [Natrinema salsiterrestre]MDF9744270.1 alpha/beta hydrolase [Natrinema salsiterrestre]
MPSTSRGSDLSTTDCTLSDGRTLTYAIGGDPQGKPVIVHHGTPGSRLFAGVCSRAAARNGVRLVVPDRPGYGKSTPPPRDWTWDDWQNDLNELLDAESIDRAPFVGFSGGGPFTLAAATADRTSRIGLVSTVVPPAENTLTALSRVPFALRLLFRLSESVARVRGPDAVVQQYTDRSVAEPVRTAVADDFHEGVRQGGAAVVRETRMFAESSFDSVRSDVPIRAWHGVRDENTPLSPVETMLEETHGTLITEASDHLGTLLDCRADVLEWVTE